MMRVLGIDPGLNRTGYALLEQQRKGWQLSEGGVIRSTPGLTLAERVQEIGNGLREVLAEFVPDAVAVEQVFSHSSHPKTAILMAHARGAILYAIAESATPLFHYTPTQIKRLLTGSGKASKEQVQLAICRELHLPEPLQPNDVADAAAIGLCHGYLGRQSALLS